MDLGSPASTGGVPASAAKAGEPAGAPLLGHDLVLLNVRAGATSVSPRPQATGPAQGRVRPLDAVPAGAPASVTLNRSSVNFAPQPVHTRHRASRSAAWFAACSCTAIVPVPGSPLGGPGLLLPRGRQRPGGGVADRLQERLGWSLQRRSNADTAVPDDDGSCQSYADSGRLGAEELFFASSMRKFLIDARNNRSSDAWSKQPVTKCCPAPSRVSIAVITSYAASSFHCAYSSGEETPTSGGPGAPDTAAAQKIPAPTGPSATVPRTHHLPSHHPRSTRNKQSRASQTDYTRRHTHSKRHAEGKLSSTTALRVQLGRDVETSCCPARPSDPGPGDDVSHTQKWRPLR